MPYWALFNTNKMQYPIFIDINRICLWIGIPNNCLRLSRRPQAVFLDNEMSLLSTTDNIRQYLTTFVNVWSILWFPNPTCGVSAWPQAVVLLLKTSVPFVRNDIFVQVQYFKSYLMVVLIFENIESTGKAIPCRRTFGFRPELSSRSDW